MEMLGVDLKSIGWAVLLIVLTRWVISEKILRRIRRVPPGPTPLPIIGNLHNLSRKPHKTLAQLAKIHGPLMYLRLGYMNMIVVTSPEVARQVLQKKDAHFCDRMIPDSLCTLNFVDYAIALMPVNDRWRTFRKIANTQIFSSKTLDANQEIRMNKIKDLISELSTCSKAHVAVNIGQVAFDTSLNLVSNTIFSTDIVNLNSETSLSFKKVSWSISRDSAKPNLADFFPIFKSIDPQGLRRKMTSHLEKVLSIIDNLIDKRLASQNEGQFEGYNDVLDRLLKICQDKEEDFELHHIRHVVLDVFLAGTETTSNTIEWAMAEILHEPTKLMIVQEELDRVVGRGKFVKEEDFDRLPYLQAILNETLRLHPALPFLVPRKVKTDTEVLGFKISKDSQLIVNVWAIGRDPNSWKNPNKFEPERFLNSEIDFRGNHFELLPFGSGRRICVGIPLAIRMLLLILGNLLNFFEWKLEDGVKPETIDMDDKFGTSLQKATSLYAIPDNVVA